MTEKTRSICDLLRQHQIFRYFQINHEKVFFSSLTQLDYDSIEDCLNYIKRNNLAVHSYDKEYVTSRLQTEERMYHQFIKKGGKPQVKHPFYFTLGRCDEWFYGYKNSFGSIAFRLNEFEPSVVSFTYGDSIPTYMRRFQDGKEYRSQIYTLEEICNLIEKHGMPNEWNTFEKYGPENYIEVQVWANSFISCYDGLCYTLEGIPLHELASRAILGSISIPDYVVFQKPASCFLQKSYANPNWPWFCQLLSRIPANTFCDDVVHGLPHAFKCGLLAFALATEMKLDSTDLKTLIYASVFHDVGRNHYDNGKKHGIIGAELIDKYLDPDDTIIVDQLKEAIAKHDDNEHSQGNDFLTWLKDVDSLDYVRLGMGQFDIRYLHTLAAKSMVRCSIELNILVFFDNCFFEKLIRGEYV